MTCSTADCERDVRSRELCLPHYKQARRAGNLPKLDRGGLCLADGCTGPLKGFGLCSKHYQRFKKTGSWEKPFRSPFCSEPGCVSPTKAKGLCNKHYRTVLRAADPGKFYTYHHMRYLAETERILERNRKWRRSNLSKVNARGAVRGARRRALKAELFVEDVQHSTVWKRDHGICHLCLLPAGPDWHLDHVIPLAQRGPHCYANTAVACASCNHRKHAKAYSADPQIWEAALAAFEEFHLSSRPTEALEAST